MIDDHRKVSRIAIKRLDPAESLVPGTREYEDTEAMVLKWIMEVGPAQTLEMITKCMRHLEGTK